MRGLSSQQVHRSTRRSPRALLLSLVLGKSLRRIGQRKESEGKSNRMCGIMGYLGHKDVVPVLIDGLKRLEYRGYDSAGIAVVNGTEIQVRRASGKLKQLEEALQKNPCHGSFGI